MALPTRISNTILRTTVSQRWDVLLIPELILTRRRQDAEEDAEKNNLFLVFSAVFLCGSAAPRQFFSSHQSGISL